MRETEIEAVETHTSLTKMTDGWKNATGAHSVHFLINFSVHEFRSFVSLDWSKCSVFI